MIALVLIGALAGSDPAPRPQDTLQLCQATLDKAQLSDSDDFAWLNLNVDGAYRPVSADLHLRTPQFDAGWAVDVDRLDALGALQMFDYALPVPLETRFPVKVLIAADGRKIVEVEILALSGRVVGRDGSVSGMVQLSQEQVPNIYGIGTLAFRVLDRDGGVATVTQITLPDWSRFARGLREAGRAATRQRVAKACGPGVLI